MDQNDTPWAGLDWQPKKAVEAVTNAVKKFVPWEGLDWQSRPEPPAVKPQKMDMNVSAVPVKTEVQMKAAVAGIGPDMSDPRNNIKELDAEIKRTKDPEVLKILQNERRKNERRLNAMKAR